MASVTIRLNSIGEVKEFNRIAATVPGDVDLHSGRYCVDAKSYLRFWLSICRTSLAVSALRIMRYCPRK